MESSKPNNYYDHLRKRVAAQRPEETVRQRVIRAMVEELKFPKELLVVEKMLLHLPHLSRRKDLPRCRIDLLCFGKNIHPEYPLFPLLLLECKEGPLNAKAEHQVLGYNYFIQAPYVALANENGPFLIFPKRLPYLPSFPELLTQLTKAESDSKL